MIKDSPMIQCKRCDRLLDDWLDPGWTLGDIEPRYCADVGIGCLLYEHCSICGKQLFKLDERAVQKFCSDNCRVKGKALLEFPNLPTGTIGAIGELRVATDLLSKGYHVFRSLSPNCSCDLIAISPNGRILRIEVTKGRRDANGRIAASGSKCARYQFDVLALVTHDGLAYEPALA